MSDADYPVASDASDILEQDDLRKEKVVVDEWELTIYVQEMTGKDRDEWEAETVNQREANTTVQAPDGNRQSINLRNATARLVARCVVDEDGNRLFNEKQIKELGQKSSTALEKVAEKCRELNGLTEEDIEEMQENLSKTQPNANGGGSHSNSVSPQSVG